MAKAVAIGNCLCRWIDIHAHPTTVAESIEVALAIKRVVFAVKLLAKAATFDTTGCAGFISRSYVPYFLAFDACVVVVGSIASGTHLFAWHSRVIACWSTCVFIQRCAHEADVASIAAVDLLVAH